MDIVAEFYESNHSIVLTIVIVVILIIVIKKNQQIKNLNKRVGELNSETSEFKSRINKLETVRIENISKIIKVGSLVKLKYVLTSKIITILVSENESSNSDNQSDIKKVKIKLPLALALLNKQVGSIVKFKKDISDEQEIYVEVLEVKNRFNTETEIEIIESENLENEQDPEIQENEVEPINILEPIEADYFEINNPRFFVNPEIYNSLVTQPDYGLKINVVPIKGKHPRGYYLIPNNIAIEFIETKRKHYNWEKNKNFHQDGIPVALQNYFKNN